MTSLGFENYAEALKIYLAKYREVSLFIYDIHSFRDGISLQSRWNGKLRLYNVGCCKADFIRHKLREGNISPDQEVDMAVHLVSLAEALVMVIVPALQQVTILPETTC